MIQIVLLLLLPLLLAGCRTRTIADPELADTVVQRQEQQTPPDESVPPSEEVSLPPETEPPQETDGGGQPDEEPPSAEELSAEEMTTEETENTKPSQAGALSETGSAQFQEAAALGVTVTYDPNGGDGGVVRTVVTAGEPYGAQPEAVRRGCAFGGWWTAKSGGVQVFPETEVALSTAHTLYAHWSERRAAAVTFDGNGGRVKAKEAVLTLSDGDAFGSLPTPLREGYDFDGWFTAPEGGTQITADSVFSGDEDLTLYAHWTYDPYAFWSFTLENKTQQIYMCQQASIYVELEQEHVTQQSCSLISATGSLNIAERREDAAVTDDWVLAKKPQVVVKCVGSMADAQAVKQAVAARFPEQKVVVVSSEALGGGASALYAKLALAKYLYPDWYADVDLSAAAAELGVSGTLFYS